jgi:hypothetical protein
MWKVLDEADGLNKEQILTQMKTSLEALRGVVPILKSIDVGINVKPDSSAWDIVLHSTFDSFDDLDAYLKHPEHTKLAPFIMKVRKERAFVDYVL